MAMAAEKVTAGKKAPTAGKPPKPKSSGFTKVYQFKITLMHLKPQIWRRMQVPENYTFKSLHQAIQDAMGWEDYHLYHFEFGDGTEIEASFEDDVLDEGKIYDRDAIISDYFYAENMFAMYEYDLGASWEHKVLFEKAVQADPKQAYPRCIDGQMACPPEDIQGVSGYPLRMVMNTPPESRNEEMKELMDWLEKWRPGYDPDFFDATQVKFRDSKTGGL